MSASYPISPGLTCQKCGCSEETQRLVSYPFVYSLFFYSFHGEFKGRWCRKHQTLYRLLAGLISATAGLMGLPGLILAPKALWKLAEGGFQHKENNVKQLRNLAEAKQQRGDPDGSLACLEASYQFRSDLWVLDELQNGYKRQACWPAPVPAPILSRALPFAGLIIAALVLGVVCGLIDFLIGNVLPQKAGGLLASIQPVIQWPALFGIGVISIFLLQHLLESLLTKLRLPQSVLSNALALVSAGLLMGGILEGRAIADFFRLLFEGATLPGGNEFWMMLGAVFTRGALVEAQRMLLSLDKLSFFHTIFWCVLAAYAFFALLYSARTQTRWLKGLAEIEARSGLHRPGKASSGWTAVGLGTACLIGLAFLFPQHAWVDFLEARDHFQTGWELEYDENLEEANREFALAVQLDPYLAQGYEELGWTNAELGRTEQAITQYLKAIELKPARAIVHVYLARAYHTNEQAELAISELETAIRLDPGLADAYLDLGWELYSRGDLDAAQTNLKKAIELDPELSDAYIGLGYIYEDQGDTDLQIETLKKATHAEASYAPARALLGVAYFNSHEIDLAINSLEEAIALRPETHYVRTYLTMSYLKVGQVDKAIKFAQESLKLDAKYAAPSALLAEAYIEMNQIDLAKETLQAARAIPQKSDLERTLILNVLQDTRQYAEAEKEAEEGQRKGNYPGGFWLSLADVQTQEAHYEEALQSIAQAERGGAKLTHVLQQKAFLALAQKQPQAAVDLLNQAAALDSRSPVVHSMLANAYLDLDNDPAAVEAAQKAVQLDRYQLGGLMNLAEAQLNLRNFPKAREAALRAAELSPHLDTPHYLLAISYLENGDSENAYKELNQFIKLYRATPGWEETRRKVDEMIKKLKSQVEASS